jgi:pimeloyl-ACP methyl ester carboxylesterase
MNEVWLRHRVTPRAVAMGLCILAGLQVPAEATELERRSCGVAEVAAFALWRTLADSTAPPRPVTVGTPYELQTTDGRKLRGYKLAGEPNSRRGAIVFIQGNATNAAAIVGDLQILAAASFDVYVLDFRGYGRSEGTPRFRALLADYRQIVGTLEPMYSHLFLFGGSLGGIVAASLSDSGIDGLVIDSAPATIQSFRCPAAYNPSSHVPPSCPQWMLIRGELDRVVKPEETAPLGNQLRACGGRVRTEAAWQHIFMGPPGETADRLRAGAEFLAALADGGQP